MSIGTGLSRRERQIMDVLYRLSEGTVAEVMEQLPDPPSYSAIRATMRILAFFISSLSVLPIISFTALNPSSAMISLTSSATNRMKFTAYAGSPANFLRSSGF